MTVQSHYNPAHTLTDEPMPPPTAPPPEMSQGHMNPPDPHPWARRLGVLLVIATFLLIGTGGLVTSLNAGLSVPDWPGSFGNWIFLPARIWSDLAVMMEHNHRLTGQLAGLICIATVVASVRAYGWGSPVATLAWVVLAAYIYQGVMGGLRVTEKSVPLAVIHGVQGQLLFMLVVLLASCLGRYPARIRAALADHSGKPVISGAAYGLTLAFTVLLMFQLVLGAVVRHTNSASAIPDAPAVYGGFFPPSDEAVIAEKFYELGGGEWWVYTREPALTMDAADSKQTPDLLEHTPRVAATPPSIGLVHNQYLHRVMAMVVLPIIGMGMIHMLVKTYKDAPGLRGPVAAGSVLFVVQVLLGMSVIWSKEQPSIASSHQAVGAALLGVTTLVLIRVHLIRKHSKPSAPTGNGPS
jgi:heme a synthase